MPFELNTKYLETFINTQEYYSIKHHVELVHHLLQNKNGLGSEQTGWLKPASYTTHTLLTSDRLK